MSSDGFGLSWGHQRSYANVLSNNGTGVNGNSWLVRQMKSLVFLDPTGDPNAPGKICIVDSAIHSMWFLSGGLGPGIYVPEFRGLQVLKFDALSLEFVLTDRLTGQITKFYPNSGIVPGKFKGVTDPNGRETTAQYDMVTGELTSFVQDVAGRSSGYYYKYHSSGPGVGRLSTVTLKVDGQFVRRASYEYHSDGDDGSFGDLKSVAIEQYDSGRGAWETINRMHYRYYTGIGGGGFQHGLKYAIRGLAYQRMVESGLNPETATATELATFADYYFEYNSAKRATRERIEGGRKQFDFSYAGNSDEPSYSAVNTWNMRTVETLPDGNENRVYTNKAGQVILKIFREIFPDPADNRDWYQYTEFNDRFQVALSASFFAVDSVTEPDIGMNNTLTVTLKANAGLIREQLFYEPDDPPTPGAVAGFLKEQTVKEGAAPSSTLITTRRFEYDTHNAMGQTIHPLSALTEYPTASSGTGDGNRTEFSYTWHQVGGEDTLQILEKTTMYPVVPAGPPSATPPGQNGSGVAGVEKEIFDVFGRAVWLKDTRGAPDNEDYTGAITYMDYDAATGAMTMKIEDVDTTKIEAPMGWETVPGWGQHLVNDYITDALGRTTQAHGPWHEVQLCEGDPAPTMIRRVEFSAYLDETHETRRASGYMTGEDPTADFHTVGAVRISRMDASGNVIDEIQSTRACNCGVLNTCETFPQERWTRWTHHIFDTWGRLDATRVYHRIPAYGEGQSGANYLETVFGYDLMGRRNRVIAASGTIERLVFEARGLMTSRWVGTDDWGATDANPAGSGGANNMRRVLALVYDNEAAGGDGNVTKETRSVDDSALNNRVVDFGYDYRDRRVTTTVMDGAQVWITRVTYDNLDRPLQTTTFKTSEIDSNRLAQSRTYYDALGRVYRVETDGINPDTGGVTATVVGQNWYDLGTNVIKAAAAGQSGFTKTVFDALSRPTVTYLACRPGVAGVPEGDDNNVVDDTVIEQAATEYDRGGNVIFQTLAGRFPDETVTGPLQGPQSEPKSRDTYTATWPDALGRPRASADYGTNGGSLPARPAVAPERSDTVLVSTNRYKDSGDANAVIDPMGIETRWDNDHAGRRVRLIEGLAGVPPGPATSPCIAPTYPPGARISEYAWHSSGQLERLTLVNSATGDQITQWIFGTTLGESKVASNDLLRAKIYPESDDRPAPVAEGPEGVYARLEYTYNRQGQATNFKDADLTLHEYAYDKLGRLTADSVPFLADGLDTLVQRIGRTYDVRGLLWKVTSYATASGGTVRNEVEFGYDSFRNLTMDKQSHSGGVTGTTPAVTYAYSFASGNGSMRLANMTYPNQRMLITNYGTANGIDDHLNRVSWLKVAGEPAGNLVEYRYVGLAWQVRITYPQPGVSCDYERQGSEPIGDAGDPYNGYDRFGRTVDIRWMKDTTAIESLQYGFDRDSRRTWRKRLLTTNEDNHYGYDALSQVIDSARGNLNLNATAIGARPENEETWGYDATGNWQRYHAGSIGLPPLDQHRVHDRGNRLTQIEDNPTTMILDRAGRMQQLSPDAAGNWNGRLEMTWDAWSRITSVKNNGTVVGTYEYDGLTRRATRTVGGVKTHTYYSDTWRPLEERKDAQLTASMHYLWGARHRDDLVRRDRAIASGGPLDETRYGLMDYFSPAAITDATGTVTERYAFSAFGVRRILNPNFSPHTGGSECGFEFAFQGQFLDTESGLLNYGFRYYSPYLGRWPSKDPIEERGGRNLYGFAANSPVSHVDLLGLDDKQCKCGKEIGAALQKALEKLDQRLQQEPSALEWICRRALLNASDGWDIKELKRRPEEFEDKENKCGVKNCKETASVNGRCYGLEEINYVLWGHLTKKCGWSERDALGLATMYRGFVTAMRIEDEPKAGLATRHTWTRLGHRGSLTFEPRIPRRTPSSIEPEKEWEYSQAQKSITDNKEADRTKECPKCDGPEYSGQLTVQIRAGEGGPSL